MTPEQKERWIEAVKYVLLGSVITEALVFVLFAALFIGFPPSKGMGFGVTFLAAWLPVLGIAILGFRTDKSWPLLILAALDVVHGSLALAGIFVRGEYANLAGILLSLYALRFVLFFYLGLRTKSGTRDQRETIAPASV